VSREDAPILEVSQLVKRFGGFRALDGVSLRLHPGEVLGLVGPNGSGKTTCINVISGLYGPDGGAIRFAGRNIGGLASHLLSRLGINRTYQSPHCFLSLTVAENVAVACAYGNGGAGGGAPPCPQKTCPPHAHELGLAAQADRPAAELNSAEQKRLDLARALATAPKLLLVDELAAGLNPAELGAMAERLRALAGGGMALLVVEHLMGFIDKVTDRVVVMNAGREIFEGRLADATRDPTVVQVFLGQRHGG
jgi:branched-chain amino acid transport system ATP-binding protein